MDCDTVDSACDGELTDDGFDFAEKSDMRTKAGLESQCNEGRL